MSTTLPTVATSAEDAASARSRLCGGPITGPNVLSKAAVSAPTAADKPKIVDLFAAVLSANPNYLPGVASGAVPFEVWYSRKDPQWVRVSHTRASEPHLTGHVALRLNGCLPDGRLLEDAGAPRLSWELGMLVTRPGFRGCGLATLLLDEALASFRGPLWSSVHVDSPGHALLRKAGWREAADMGWPSDPVPGLVMVSTG